MTAPKFMSARSQLRLLALVALSVIDFPRASGERAGHDCGDAASMVCQGYRAECRSGLNEQIGRELAASHLYLSMAAHFEHDLMAKPGFAKFFYRASEEERGHALKLIEYHTKRGGKVILQSVEAPQQTEWANGLAAMRAALMVEKEVNAHLLRLHTDCKDDPATLDFLEHNFLTEQVESIKQLADYVRQLKNLHDTNEGLGEHIFDRDLK